MTERPPAGASIEERLAAIEEKLWPPPPRVHEHDIRIDIYRPGVNGLGYSTIRVTHVPTGIVTTAERKSQLQGKAACLEELEDKLIKKGWFPDVHAD